MVKNYRNVKRNLNYSNLFFFHIWGTVIVAKKTILSRISTRGAVGLESWNLLTIRFIFEGVFIFSQIVTAILDKNELLQEE